MELIELTRRTHLFICKAINVLTSLQYTLRDRKKYADYTKKNMTLKNISEGETCYILGNGPSLNRVDLSKLKGKHIITVNKFLQQSCLALPCGFCYSQEAVKYLCLFKSGNNKYSKNRSACATYKERHDITEKRRLV